MKNRVAGAMLPFEDLEHGLTSETLDTFKDFVASVIRAPNLLADQQEAFLAGVAAKTLPYPSMSDRAREAILSDVLCLLAEGGAPFHFRYLAPDFKKLLEQGSEFLELKPAENLHEATAMLLTAYNYVPDHGLTPVCIGRIDDLLDPFLDTVSPSEARAVLRSFWLLVDRLYPNAFVHASLGPEETRTGRLMLELDRELETICNVALRYDPEITSRAFALDAVQTALQVTKPYFFNHRMMLDDWGPDYAIASCYNCMLTGGGIYTMARLNLKRLVALTDASIEDTLDTLIPEAAHLQMEVIDGRIRFLVEELNLFEKSFLVHEGLLSPDRFTAYAAVFGLAEAVNILMERAGRPEARYGHDAEANELGVRIIERLASELRAIPAPYCDGTAGHVSFHAQVGINPDIQVTPGVRVPPGEEPDLYEHLQAEAPHHRLLDGGVSTILEFDQTARENPEAVLDIVNGAIHNGIRTLSVGSVDSEFIRVSGYLVRRSDLEAARAERAMRYETVDFASVVFTNRPEALRRRTRQV